ncbi:S1 family peptidase [Pseudobacteriovorax antillogorgiicola]|uniref:Trypsin n=1 Tax=Pseudobacteriovorax antillogorgiicola TaxID=1513793 RepID=A0A1Y6C186_9BACT|nr:trypsin-like serine protease [Pseudobacteriovorax antillogorgiicola]TCS52468.1 trypsin [Pseudobacteriovorax antillogorgiicola]SMF28396.1 Trypsin [Pseudobacteriovorax antillogorgiicola]
MELFRLSAGFAILLSIISCNSEPKSYRTESAGGSATSASQTSSSNATAALNPQCQSSRSALTLAGQQGFGIVQGTVARNEDPVTASTVKVYLPGGHCTGTLIGPNQIVTAAHCFESGSDATQLKFLTSANSVKIGMGVNGQVLQNVAVESFVVHPCYEGILGDAETGRYLERVYYDVGLITFSGTLPTEFAPVNIATPAELQSQPRVTIAGYGAYSQNDRNVRPLTQVDTFIEEINALQEIQLEVNGKGACFGDSGGPTYIADSSGNLKLVGSTTGPGRASDYSCEDGSGTMMDITSYRGWIKCSLEAMNEPLDYLDFDDSAQFCKDNAIIN